MPRDIFLTSFCNFGHDMSSGVPVNHECYVIPPKLLRMGRDGTASDRAYRAAWDRWFGQENNRQIIDNRGVQEDEDKLDLLRELAEKHDTPDAVELLHELAAKYGYRLTRHQ